MPAPTSSTEFAFVGWLSRRPRRQVVLGTAAVAVVLAVRAMRRLAAIVLDRWWLDSLTDAPVWSRVTGAKLQLLVVAVVATAVILVPTAWSVTRPPTRDRPPYGPIVRRVRSRLGPGYGWLVWAVVAIALVRVGGAAPAQWSNWLLIRHGRDLGVDVPELGGDLGGHLFDLPFLSATSGWLRATLLLALVLAVAGHVLRGALRAPWTKARSESPALTHVALLAAALLGAQALHVVFVVRPGLATHASDGFVGLGYTQARIVLPALAVAAVATVLAGLALVESVRRQSYRPAAIGLVVAGAAYLIGLVLVPMAVQRYVVGSSTGQRQLRYLEHNLEATRAAYDLDTVDEAGFRLVEASAEDRAIAERVPLFTVDQMAPALQVLQGTTATRITDVDLDRYEIDGEIRPVMVGARSPSRADLPESGWVQTHLVYTHGNGVVAVPADRPDADGRPDVEALTDTIVTDRPELYFGEGVDEWYAIVGTRRAEQDGATFRADTGLDISSFGSRAVLALAVGEYQPLLTDELDEDSQLLYRRGLVERLDSLVPYATWSSDPHPVVTPGGITWIVDGFTTASTYPYAQRTVLAGQTVNFVSPSLKATVDAYDGTVHVYRTELGLDDPLLAVWDEIFPGLLEPIDDVPTELRSHLFTPPWFTSVQSSLLGRYHVDTAEALFNGTERWSIAAAPIDTVGSTGPLGPAPLVRTFVPVTGGISLADVAPFSPGAAAASSTARDVLSAVLVADHDQPGSVPVMLVNDEPASAQRATPAVAQSVIDADPDLAQRFTLLNANGSTVRFGPMTPVPIDGRLAWVRSVIVTGTAATAVPRVFGVVAVDEGRVGMGDDVTAALADAGGE